MGYKSGPVVSPRSIGWVIIFQEDVQHEVLLWRGQGEMRLVLLELRRVLGWLMPSIGGCRGGCMLCTRHRAGLLRSSPLHLGLLFEALELTSSGQFLVRTLHIRLLIHHPLRVMMMMISPSRYTLCSFLLPSLGTVKILSLGW